MADLSYLASTCECSHLLDALKGKEIFDPVYHTATMKEVREEMKKKKLVTSDDILRKVESGIQKKDLLLHPTFTTFRSISSEARILGQKY